MSNFFKKFPQVDYDFDRNGILQTMTDIFRHVKPLENSIDEMLGYNFYNVIDGERPDVVSERLYGTGAYYWTFFVVNEKLHDGYREWPMSEIDFSEYLDKKYEGVAIVPKRPKITTNTDGLVLSTTNALAGRFQIGEVIKGSDTLATGTLKQKNVDMHHLVLQNVSGNFKANGETETLTGLSSSDKVDTFRLYNYIDAPYQYYNELDPNKRAVSYSNAFEDSTQGRANTVEDANIAFITNRQYEIELNEERSKIRYVDPAYIQDFVRKYENLINE